MKEYKLNIDTRILELLGPNLYTNIYYVLAELIANAYDADAKNVYIISNKDDIRVEDDGHGMSYDAGDISKYLNVAAVSRSSEDDSYTRSGTRRKMGRKGVGKLAALSVSENVDVMTVCGGEKSGFILSRKPEDENKLRPIIEDTIRFDYIGDHGSAIVMRNPRYRLHKTTAAIRHNLLKIFPLVSSEFRIHVVRGAETIVIDDFDKEIMEQLGTLITLGEKFSPLCSLVPDSYPQRRSDLVIDQPSYVTPIELEDAAGTKHEYSLEIEGWIGTYLSTRDRKVNLTDFPDNFISLFANKKMGEFNILPVVGQNKLNEVYVVGQLHVDLFEMSELPDMALSNRQGYKSDDPRYDAVLNYVRKFLLPQVLRTRDTLTDLKNKEKKRKKEEDLRKDEIGLREAVDRFRENASRSVADKISELGGSLPRDTIERVVLDSINQNSPDLGLKSVVDSQKKKILISQTRDDKALSDTVYKMLVYNHVPEEEILYTNCDDEICRVPEGSKVYDYLRDFFVDSYSRQKMLVLFVTSQNTMTSWGAITEVGAAWITKMGHKIFNIRPFRPEHPLDDEQQWQSTNRGDAEEDGIWMDRLNADIFCQKIESVCEMVGRKPNDRQTNIAYLKGLVTVR